MKQLHAVSYTIFSSLSTSLKLPPGGQFTDFHRLNSCSADLVRVLKYHTQPDHEFGSPHIAHTDLGSLTILFNRQEGLQIIHPKTNDWSFVHPRQGHAIINIGDGLSLLSNGLFRSGLHRVVPLPGETMKTRYALGYFLRAEDNTVMSGLESDLIPQRLSSAKALTSKQWLDEKFKALRLGTHEEGDHQIVEGSV